MKLDIKSVEFRNFLSFGARWQKIEFREGVNAVLGHDVDRGKSNGSGKSSFLETVPFALFGQVQRGIKKEQIINWKNKKNCEVRCLFSKGDTDYAVVRAIKPDNFEIYENGNIIDKESNVRDYQKILEEIMGISFNTFISIVHSNINSSQKILAMKKPEKRKFLENVFGLGIYSRISARAQEKIRTLQEKKRELELRKEMNDRAMSDAQFRLNGHSNRISMFEDSYPLLQEAKDQYEKLLADNPNIDEEIEELRSEIVAQQTKFEQMNEIVNYMIGGKIQYVRFEKMSPILRELEIVGKQKAANKERAEKQYRLEQFEKGHGSLEDLKKCVEEWKAEVEKYETQHKEMDNLLWKLEHDSIQLEKELEQFEEGICPTCGQKVEGLKLVEEKTTQLNYVSSQLMKFNEIASDIETKLYESKRKLESDKKALEAYKLLRASLGNEIKLTEYTEEELLAKKKKWEDVLNKYDKCAKKIMEKNQALDIEINKLERKKRMLETTLTSIDEALEKVENLRDKIQQEKRMAEEIKAMMAFEAQTIKNLRAENIEFNNRVKSNEVMLDYLETIKDCCKDEHLKQYAISSIMPYLNSRTNHYLSEVGYGFYAVLDKWLDVNIKGPGVSNATYGSLSGGEARGIDLALQFALLDIARVQAHIWPDILIMDEILDSSVDTASIGKLMDIVKTKQAEDRTKVFIISHRQEIDEVDNIYFIRKENGYSHVEIK